ncbi:1-acyl-sn-glycerol-3-phosphate acyltransferase [Fictibacillus sp. WQ 8-8]|uniref:1-acyl-sn-glycerol-3-phosphate acyltransferase n=1 Tax=Fictibacillus marinisediminis TaxID=2878389 RepID=A0A9X2BHE7_9BACL|nr:MULTISPECIES: lysophospholipid acyltransferase family protein [unclassified Fictibacillus]MCK6257533.1 1-acyl-sn-glycerol-3-phosphate acyltransferase [Fictibacillus marinisediminis]SFD73060.1 1-acyl-sn-glycerol-3-phosphate acyltransferase [Bacillus sp. OV194]MCQ6266047.1 1-acyl-sn-glycerol-3-phosphate acyltransferase [Fictibacillus sp. WQ 8-8]MED2972733.1 lysophospholipid acyltransferase family protein [Fictibacillus sp. B-59209]UZJ80813.1 1-acyl-sn-glycerol-3-phosphate acyltransferase [Fic
MNLYKFGKAVCGAFLKSMYKIDIQGLENVPADGGILLCSNHINNFDPPLVGVAAPRDVHFMAKAELFSMPVLKTILPKINAFPVKRGMSDKQALRNGLSILKEGKVLGLFPEGTRSKTGQLGQGLAGAGFFALKSEAAVVPCAIKGEYKRGKKITIIFGKPIDFTEMREQKASAKDATNLIMLNIEKLLMDSVS